MEGESRGDKDAAYYVGWVAKNRLLHEGYGNTYALVSSGFFGYHAEIQPNQEFINLAANFVGLERIVGRLGDRSGSFVLQHSGTFEGGTAKATWFVVPGSGTGDLRGLRGEGGFASGHANSYLITLDYDFE